MSVYSISLFLHVVGALGLFAALGLEWAGLSNLRRATETSQAREWVRLLAAPRFAGGPAALVILISGIYMSATRWGPRAWTIVALTGMVVIAVLGAAVSGRRTGAIARALRLRVSLFLGIVFLMSTRPGWTGSVVAMVFALIVGVSGSVPSWSGARRQARMAGSER